MRQGIFSLIFGLIFLGASAFGDEQQPAAVAKPQGIGDARGSGAQTALPISGGSGVKTEEDKLLGEVRDALRRNAQEIKALKEQYARDVEEQRKTIAAQQQKIEALDRAARQMAEQLNKQTNLGQSPPEFQRQKSLTDLQQKQLEVIEEQSVLVADQVNKQGPAIEKLQEKTATLESRTKQAAQRDREIADSQDALVDTVDSQFRNPPLLPTPLKELFVPSGTNVSPITIFNTISTRYDLSQKTLGAGKFGFEEYTPFVLYQLNKRLLLSAEASFSQAGVGLGQAQIDMFINNWLTADVGYFLAPIGFWNERLDPRWINKLPDIPLVMRQVIPDGLTITGLQFRGAKYIAKSPWKVEYSGYMTNGLGVPGAGKAADWYDLGALTATTSGVNSAMAYGGRIGIWLPTRGINFGVSEFVNAPYSKDAGALVSVWQPYFNYHRGNWDARFEYGQNYEKTKSFIGNDINRVGLYTQLAYRNYQSLHQHTQRLEYVFRYSETSFRGIDPKQLDLTTFSSPVAAPVNRNQYTFGLNYYVYASSIVKFAYEINSEPQKSLRDNVFMMQFATNF